MDDKALAVFAKVQRMILDSPRSSGGEYIWHRDGSVTENKWKAQHKDG